MTGSHTTTHMPPRRVAFRANWEFCANCVAMTIILMVTTFPQILEILDQAMTSIFGMVFVALLGAMTQVLSFIPITPILGVMYQRILCANGTQTLVGIFVCMIAAIYWLFSRNTKTGTIRTEIDAGNRIGIDGGKISNSWKFYNYVENLYGTEIAMLVSLPDTSPDQLGPDSVVAVEQFIRTLDAFGRIQRCPGKYWKGNEIDEKHHGNVNPEYLNETVIKSLYDKTIIMNTTGFGDYAMSNPYIIINGEHSFILKKPELMKNMFYRYFGSNELPASNGRRHEWFTKIERNINLMYKTLLSTRNYQWHFCKVLMMIVYLFVIYPKTLMVTLVVGFLCMYYHPFISQNTHEMTAYDPYIVREAYKSLMTLGKFKNSYSYLPRPRRGMSFKLLQNKKFLKLPRPNNPKEAKEYDDDVKKIENGLNLDDCHHSSVSGCPKEQKPEEVVKRFQCLWEYFNETLTAKRFCGLWTQYVELSTYSGADVGHIPKIASLLGNVIDDKNWANIIDSAWMYSKNGESEKKNGEPGAEPKPDAHSIIDGMATYLQDTVFKGCNLKGTTIIFTSDFLTNCDFDTPLLVAILTRMGVEFEFFAGTLHDRIFGVPCFEKLVRDIKRWGPDDQAKQTD